MSLTKRHYEEALCFTPADEARWLQEQEAAEYAYWQHCTDFPDALCIQKEDDERQHTAWLRDRIAQFFASLGLTLVIPNQNQRLAA
jgi:hypothetical protein